MGTTKNRGGGGQSGTLNGTGTNGQSGAEGDGDGGGEGWTVVNRKKKNKHMNNTSLSHNRQAGTMVHPSSNGGGGGGRSSGGWKKNNNTYTKNINKHKNQYNGNNYRRGEGGNRCISNGKQMQPLLNHGVSNKGFPSAKHNGAVNGEVGTRPAQTYMTAQTSQGKRADSEHSKQADDKPTGLVNVGNTCYINSILQCISCLPRFSKYVKVRRHDRFFYGRKASSLFCIFAFPI